MRNPIYIFCLKSDEFINFICYEFNHLFICLKYGKLKNNNLVIVWCIRSLINIFCRSLKYDELKNDNLVNVWYIRRSIYIFCLKSDEFINFICYEFNHLFICLKYGKLKNNNLVIVWCIRSPI